MKFYYCHCPLTRPINIEDVTITERSWIEIDLEKSGKKVDLAPLPGLHRESLEESLEDFKSENSLTPSAQFAKEVISNDFFSNSSRSKLNKLEYIDLSMSPQSYLSRWNKDEVVKIKIGRNKLESESDWLRQLFKLDTGNIRFRLDANRSLSCEQLDLLLMGLVPNRIEYLEEPLKDINEWNKSAASKNYDLALDESISKRDLIDACKYLVVKPTYNLSLNETLKEIDSAQYKLVISSSFDPPNNIEILHRLGSLCGTSSGLDTLKYFDLSQTKKRPL